MKCPCCDREVRKLREHHWFDESGTMYTKDVCCSCNTTLSTPSDSENNHVLPPFDWQRTYCKMRILDRAYRRCFSLAMDVVLLRTLDKQLRARTEISRWRRLSFKRKKQFFLEGCQETYQFEVCSLFSGCEPFRLAASCYDATMEGLGQSRRALQHFGCPGRLFEANCSRYSLLDESSKEYLKLRIEEVSRWLERELQDIVVEKMIEIRGGDKQ